MTPACFYGHGPLQWIGRHRFWECAFDACRRRKLRGEA